MLPDKQARCPLPCRPLILLVGAGRFERPTPCAQGRCATRLRYAPTFADSLILIYFQRPSKPLGPNPSGFPGKHAPGACLYNHQEETAEVSPLCAHGNPEDSARRLNVIESTDAYFAEGPQAPSLPRLTFVSSSLHSIRTLR